MFDCDKYYKISKNIKNAGLNTKILVISKNKPPNDIKQALKCGVGIFGENRVQEAKVKFQDNELRLNRFELHLTGPLQTNKVKQALSVFNVFHTLDREKLLKEFVKHLVTAKNKNFFIQINTGKEESKSGVYPENAESFLKLCYSFGLKNIEGLMCIPPIDEDPTVHFKLLDSIRSDLGLKKLSIGMSADYEKALSFNPAYIRLGTILFGERK